MLKYQEWAMDNDFADHIRGGSGTSSPANPMPDLDEPPPSY